MLRMFKDAKMTGEMLVYFCTVKTQGPVSLRKNAQYKVRKQTKTKLTVNSNYFYYHIVIL